MRRVLRVLCSTALAAGLLAGSSQLVVAHHSFAMFDTANPITIAGVVTAMQWTNPHAYIEVDVVEGQSKKHWTIELGSTSILQRAGWKFNSIKPGDKITALVSPLRNGEPGSLLTRVTLPDGRVLANGGGPTGSGTVAPPARPPAAQGAR